MRYANAEKNTGHAYNTDVITRFLDVTEDGGATTRGAFRNNYSWKGFWTHTVPLDLTTASGSLRLGNTTGNAPNIDWLAISPLVTKTTNAPDAALKADATASTRKLAGKVYITVDVTNTSSVVTDVAIATAYGSKTFTGVQPGKKVSVSINTTRSSIPAGQATVTLSGTVNGSAITQKIVAPTAHRTDIERGRATAPAHPSKGIFHEDQSRSRRRRAHGRAARLRRIGDRRDRRAGRKQRRRRRRRHRPRHHPGALIMTVAPGRATLQEDGSTDTVRRFTGSLPQVTVTDTRNAAQLATSSGWYVLGSASAFTGAGGATIGADHLGWSPKLVTGDADTVSIGGDVGTALDESTGDEAATNRGLVDKELLALGDPQSLPDGGVTSTATADLTLKVESTVPAGAYSSVITLSLFE